MQAAHRKLQNAARFKSGKAAGFSGRHPTYIGQPENGEKNAEPENGEKAAAALP